MPPGTDTNSRIEWANAQLEKVGRTPFDFQRSAWRAYLDGESGLVNAATGTGKTLAAALGPMLECPRPPAGLRMLWITPLRALANDLAVNLEAAATVIDAAWRIGIRTGDTTTAQRRQQKLKPPQLLIITPESLSVLLSEPATHELLRGLSSIVVDEWHELLGSKRGVQLELCLAHLRNLNPAMRSWGLSATLPNLEEACQVLVGQSTQGRLIRSNIIKQIDISSVLPGDVTRFPWAGHLGIRLLDDVLAHIANARSTLLFTNTRSQAELWYQAIANARRDWLTELALHHGSIDRGIRMKIEQALRDGKLRCVVATSSLDLGVDFTPVEQVIQIGSPKGVARLVQRAGRSGHRPDAGSRVICVPTHAWELVEIAAVREGVARGRIEARTPLRNSIDVLTQHLVTLAAGPGFTFEQALAEARATVAFQGLSDAAFGWALDFITRGGQALQGYPQFRRVQREDGIYRIADAHTARRHRMAIGTITSDTAMQLRFQSGGSLGSVEESFISRLKPGDDFVFAGRVLTLMRVRDMTAYVALSPRRSRHVPRWQGGRMPLSTELADLMLLLIGTPEVATSSHPELAAVSPLLELQAKRSLLPAPGVLLVESSASREGHHLFVYPFSGRQINEGLGMLIASRWARAQPQSFTITATDYGFELLSPTPIHCDVDRLRAALDTTELAADLLACVNLSELARRRFRDIARIAGLVFPGFPGAGKSSRQLQASGGLMYDVLTQHDSENLLLAQARTEVLESQLEVRQLREAMEQQRLRKIAIVATERLTPLAFPIWAERLQSQMISTEKWKDRVRRAAEALEKQASRND
jgi:ATP-dependent helicase Lhr and Lhr-like helicase